MSTIEKLLDENLIFLNAKCSSSKEILSFISDKLLEQGKVKESFNEAIIEREDKYPTGLRIEPYGIAIPHTDAEHVISPCIAVVRMASPVAFVEMAGTDQVDVTFIFCLVFDKSQSHAELLGSIMKMCTTGEMMEQLYDASDKVQILKILKQFC